VDGMGLSAVNKVATKLVFRLMLLKNAYSKEQFQQKPACASIFEASIFRKRTSVLRFQ
jgi:hypothetical protein